MADAQICQIEFVFSDRDVSMPYGKPAVATCSDCGTAICSECRVGMLWGFPNFTCSYLMLAELRKPRRRALGARSLHQRSGSRIHLRRR
jgi:hypothetical protein